MQSYIRKEGVDTAANYTWSGLHIFTFAVRFSDNVSLAFGDDNDSFIISDGTNINVIGAGTWTHAALNTFNAGLTVATAQNLTLGAAGSLVFSVAGSTTATLDGQPSIGVAVTWNWTDVKLFLDDTDVFHQIGGTPAAFTPADLNDRLVVVGLKDNGAGVRRAFIGELDITSTSAQSNTLSAVNGRIYYSGSANLTNSTIGVVAGRYMWDGTAGTGTITLPVCLGANFVTGTTNVTTGYGLRIENFSSTSSGNVTDFIGVGNTGGTWSGTGTVTRYRGFYAPETTLAATNWEYAVGGAGGFYFGINDGAPGSSTPAFLRSDAGDGSNLVLGISNATAITFAATTITFANTGTDPVLNFGSVSGELALTTGTFRTGSHIEIDGDLNHDGSNVGFYNVAPVARPAAYTQTYATATRTHSNLTSATLTDSTGGTANTTVVAIAGTGDDANINNNFADVVAQINALRVDLENAKQVLNQVIDDHQANGLLQ